MKCVIELSSKKIVGAVFVSSVVLAACSGQVGSVEGATASEVAAVDDDSSSIYDSFQKPGGYTLADYSAKWTTPFGLGEMGHADTRSFADRTFSIGAAPFTIGSDFGVFDHIKYFAHSTKAFAIPADGSVTYSMDIKAETPGTQPGKVMEGTYGPSGSYPNGEPYSATLLEGQQASATMHMMDFATGQLFNWFVSEHGALAIVERLASAVTNPQLPPSDPNYVGRSKMYTSILAELPITPGQMHQYKIRYTRTPNKSFVEFFLDNRPVAKVDQVGIPLDKQGVPYTGLFPSLGPGEVLKDKVNSVVVAHGLFSLVDPFPWQHPEAPELSVSIPISNRLFGQGVRAQFGDVRVSVR